MIDRKIPPAFSSDYSLTLPAPQQQTLANNARILWLSGVGQEVTKIEFVFNNGKWAEPKNGVSFFTGALIDKGTTSLDSNTIAEKLDELGAQIECASGLDYLSLSLYTLNRKLEPALALVAKILTDASFPEDELIHTKQIQLQNLKINNERTNVVASRLLRKNIFGANHPYGRYLDEASIDAIQQNDLVNFYKVLSLNNVFVTGNIGEQELKSLATFVEGFRTIENHTEPFKPTPLDHTDSSEKPGSVQSSIRLGKISINKHHPDFAAFTLLNHILGGYFGSRLMKNIREEKGLTYGINSSINSFIHSGVLLIGAEVNKENTNLTIEEIRKEIMRLQTQHIKADELAIARTHLIGSLQVELSNPFSVMEKIKSISLNSLSPNYYDQLLDTLLSLKAPQLQEISIKYLSLDDLKTVVVG